MARASIPTLLSLDRWAQIVGIDPRHFNQVVIDLSPMPHCKQVWTQHSWQAADAIGREEIAWAIKQAEDELADILGYSPLPVWAAGEVKRTTPPSDPAALGCSNLQTPAGRFRSVTAGQGMVISGGVRVATLLGTPAVAWQDLDADGYNETAQLQQATTVIDPDELRVYFAGHGGRDEWEIRPLRSVTIAAGLATILIDRHLLVLPTLWEALNPQEVDGDLVANFVTTADVYRVYNDPSQQAQLQWERTPGDCDCGSATCASCAWAVQWACLQTRDPRLGIMNYQPADWDAADAAFVAAVPVVDRQPERVRLWYRAGWWSSRVDRPSQQMDPFFERLVALRSICLLDRPVCGCGSAEAFHKLWTEDRALIRDAAGGRYQIADLDLTCPWGTQNGSLEAWRGVQNLRGPMAAVGRGLAY